MAGGHSHRTTLKNNHKPFKSKHASKGALKNKYKGKVEKSASNGPKLGTNSKLERKNLVKQLRENKIMSAQLERKLFSGANGAERVVSIIPLTPDVNPLEIAEKLLSEEDVHITEIPSMTSVKVKKFKANLKVVIPDMNNFVNVLDVCKVSDFVVFGLSACEEVDPKVGEQFIRAIELQGVSSVVGVVTNLVSSYPKKNLQQDALKSLSSYFHHFFPQDDKLFSLESVSESTNCLRTLCQKFPKSVAWRDERGYLLADHVEWDSSCLVVEGVVRGCGFNANRLVHIPGHGDFQLDRIEKMTLSSRGKDVDMKDEDEDTFKADPEAQESLQELAEHDLSMDEMEDDSMDESDGSISDEARTKRVIPKGMSEYQARWYDNDELEQLVNEQGAEEEGEPEDDAMDVEDSQDNFHDLSPEEEERQLNEFRQQEKDDLEFPDELELHPQERATERLKRYRGVKSLGNCEWDCDEDDEKKPSEWNSLLRIPNFKNTKKKLLKKYVQEAQVVAGNRVRLFVKVPPHLADARVFVVYGLVEHEHQLAVTNFSMQHWEDFEEPIPSKETIIVQYGPRRQVIEPLFSNSHNTPNNVHKYDRFFRRGDISIATVIAPVSFPNTPAIYFKQSSETGALQLIGHGTLLNCDHTRILAKKIVLTGYPIKIHKKVVTARYMFFNTEDINAFMTLPLFTKSGRSGFIKESLGTHGYFKARFDRKITSQDTICMALYKREWPRVSSMWVG